MNNDQRIRAHRNLKLDSNFLNRKKGKMMIKKSPRKKNQRQKSQRARKTR